MKKYGDLNLRKIREDNDLDFAHFTYRKGQCSCCYGPLDMAARYWKKKPVYVVDKPATQTSGGWGHYELDGEKINTDSIQYVLFKNANNGSGTKTKNDDIGKYTCVSWKMPQDKLKKVCQDLKSQLDEDYTVYMPTSDMFCILIIRNDYEFYNGKEKELKGYVEV